METCEFSERSMERAICQVSGSEIFEGLTDSEFYSII